MQGFTATIEGSCYTLHRHFRASQLELQFSVHGSQFGDVWGSKRFGHYIFNGFGMLL